MTPAEGARVEILAGRLAGQKGVITWSGRDGGCGCLSAVVRTDSGREWYGKLKELKPS